MSYLNAWLDKQYSREVNSEDKVAHAFRIKMLKNKIIKMIEEEGLDNILSDDLEISIFDIGTTNASTWSEKYFHISLVQRFDNTKSYFSKYVMERIDR